MPDSSPTPSSLTNPNSPLSQVMLEESRGLFQTRLRAGLRLRLLGSAMVPLSEVCPMEAVYPDLIPHYELLWEQGKLVWGAVIRVHDGAFEAGKDAPITMMLYSTSTDYEGRLDALLEVAHELRSLPTRQLQEKIENKLVQTIQNNTPLFHQPVPGFDALFLGSLRLHRSRLPLPLITQLWFPIIIASEMTSTVMVLPSAYWAGALIERWQNPTPASQPSSLHYQLHPFILTKAAGALLCAQIQAQGYPPRDVYLQPGPDHLLELTTMPRPDAIRTVSEQVQIAIPPELLSYYAGTLLTVNAHGVLSLCRLQ